MSILVKVLLARIWKAGTIILEDKRQQVIKTISESYLLKISILSCIMYYLLAMVGGISSTHQVLVGPTIQIRIFSTDKAISCVANLTVTFIHRITEVAKVDAFGESMTIMCLVLARVVRFTNLWD